MDRPFSLVCLGHTGIISVFMLITDELINDGTTIRNEWCECRFHRRSEQTPLQNKIFHNYPKNLNKTYHNPNSPT